MSNNNGDGKEEPNLKRYAHSRERKRKHRSLSELLALLAQQKENYGTRVNSHYHHLNAIDKFTLTDGTVVTKLANTPLGEGASSEVHKGTDSSRKEYALKYIKIQEDVASLRQEIDLFNKYYAGDRVLPVNNLKLKFLTGRRPNTFEIKSEILEAPPLF